MTSRNRLFAVVTLPICAAILVAGAWFASAGDLNPPAGPVAPTHKTLTEVEPRIAVNATNTPGDNDASPSLFKITQPGSYYLTGNISGVSGKSGIEIAANDVTLDLSGFELLGVPGSLDGIDVPAIQSGIAVRNGAVRAWGQRGVVLLNGTVCIVEGVRAVANGTFGIQVASSAVVNGCTAESNGGTGISAGSGCTVSGCAARLNVTGIAASFGSTVTTCSVLDNTGDGITASGAAVTGCSSTRNGDDGITALSSRVEGCICRLNTGDGIEADDDCSILTNTCDSNGFGAGDGAGIHGIGDDTRIEGNHVTDNDRGIDVDTVEHLVIRNSASGNTVNYDIVAGNTVGPTVDMGNIGTSNNPHANYDF